MSVFRTQNSLMSAFRISYFLPFSINKPSRPITLHYPAIRQPYFAISVRYWSFENYIRHIIETCQ